MVPTESRERLIYMAIALLVLLGPVFIIALTLGFLALTGDLILGRISLIEFLELYILDALLFIVLAYAIYRLTSWLVEYRLPRALDTLETREHEASENDDSEPTEDSDHPSR